jgi:uncharacterized membrane protein SpoIIM required for sporulation
MSQVIDDTGRMFTAFTRNIFTVLGLIAGIAVLSFALPYIIGLVSTITGLTNSASQTFGQTSSTQTKT